MARTYVWYPEEYEAEIVRLVREDGRIPSDLAREFEPSMQSIANWVAQAEINAGAREWLTTDEKAELKRLGLPSRIRLDQSNAVDDRPDDRVDQGVVDRLMGDQCTKVDGGDRDLDDRVRVEIGSNGSEFLSIVDCSRCCRDS
jgi:transposase-like protein